MFACIIHRERSFYLKEYTKNMFVHHLFIPHSLAICHKNYSNLDMILELLTLKVLPLPLVSHGTVFTKKSITVNGKRQIIFDPL